MNLLELFKKKPEQTISKDLFINDRPPLPEEIIDLINDDLKRFMGLNYEIKGIEDGYKHHNKSYKVLFTNSLTEKLLILIDKRIKQIEEDKQSLKLTKIDYEGLNEDICQKLTLALECRNRQVEDLRNQEKLVSLSQGWIRSIIADYEVGFEQGASSYFDSNEFLKSTPLF